MTEDTLCGDKPKYAECSSSSQHREFPTPQVEQHVAGGNGNIEGLGLPKKKICKTLHVKRGVALIFSHYKFINGRFPLQEGTNKDCSDIAYVWKYFGFDVRIHKDKKFDDIKDILEKAAAEDHTNSDCLVVVMMSHGADDLVYSSDKLFPISDLWNSFMGYNCPTLIGKPKLIFINANRGKKLDSGVEVKIQTSGDGIDEVGKSKSEPYCIPLTSDLLLMYSTFEGHQSFINPEMGSWFIQALCAELLQNWEETDLLSILTSVSRRVAYEYESNVPDKVKMHGKKQISSITTMLTQHISLSKTTLTLSKETIFGRILPWISGLFDRVNFRIWDSPLDPPLAITQAQSVKTIEYHDIPKEYDTTNKKRGVALIFNHFEFTVQHTDLKPRLGTYKDRDDLEKVLNLLKFDVRIFNDKKYQEIMEVLQKVAQEDHIDHDCIFVVVLSHGDKDGVYANDLLYPVNELWSNFMGNKCESLIGKPKLFFINACRGTIFDSGVILPGDQEDSTASGDRTDNTSDQKKNIAVIPQMADLLVMYSAYDEHCSWINDTDGSWFIQAMCTELLENWEDTDLLKILTGVCRSVAYEKRSNVPGNVEKDRMRQMPCITTMLTKKFYFLNSKM